MSTNDLGGSKPNGLAAPNNIHTIGESHLPRAGNPVDNIQMNDLLTIHAKIAIAVYTAWVAGCGFNDQAKNRATDVPVVAESSVALKKKATVKTETLNNGGSMSLKEALTKRRSHRNFRRRELTEQMLLDLAFAAQGITSDRGLRTAPSAGATYPLELHVVTPNGVFRYEPKRHELVNVTSKNHMAALSRAALGQRWVAEAGANFVFGAVVARTASRYGDRAERYVHIEAGCAAQNLMLTATSLGLGSVMVGAHDDDALKSIAGLPDESEVIVMVSVGVPK